MVFEFRALESNVNNYELRPVLLLLIVSNISNLNTLIPKIGLHGSQSFSPTTKSYGWHFET